MGSRQYGSDSGTDSRLFKTIGKHEFSGLVGYSYQDLKDKAARCMLWIPY